jgi:GPI-anchor transamidase subunit S
MQADTMQEQEAQNLLRLTQHALDDLNDFSAAHHLRLELATEEESQSALTIRLAPGDAMASVLDPHSPILGITYPPNAVPSHTSSTSGLAAYIAKELRSTFSEEQALISHLLSASPSASHTPPESKPSISPEMAVSLAKRQTRALKYSGTYHITFSLFTAGPTPNTWDVEAAFNEYMKPMLDLLGPIHNFTIDTQLQLYATPGVHSEVLNKDHLASFINAAEWPLSPSIGGAPTINFVIYIGNQTVAVGGAESETETSQSWLVPQWGTVYLLSLPGATAHVPTSILKQPMLTFAGHLLSLLGTPESGSLPLRLSTLSRVRSADLLLRASDTLGALARLSLALPSISIPRSVADGVATTIRHLELACANLAAPRALAHARTAEEEAERAFFEKSMVGQLYFPDEHKIAVYLPLLGPVAVPLVMGFVNEMKAWLKKRRQRAEDAARKKE